MAVDWSLVVDSKARRRRLRNSWAEKSAGDFPVSPYQRFRLFGIGCRTQLPMPQTRGPSGRHSLAQGKAQRCPGLLIQMPFEPCKGATEREINSRLLRPYRPSGLPE